MKALHSSIILVGLAGLLSACNSSSSSEEAMIAAANDLDARFLAALNSSDVEAFTATYWQSPDVVNFPPDAMEARGWDEIQSTAAAMFDAMPGAKVEILENHQMVAGDVVIGWGLWRMTIPNPEGEPTVMEGRYTDVKAERDGKWVYILDHASVPLPPPAE